MAQLPPKAPSTPSLHFQTVMNMPPPPFPSTSTLHHHSSWVDEFLDFSATRRVSHRRTASDPIAFTESPFPEASRNSCTTTAGGAGGGFDRLDDEQLRCMFSDDTPAGSSIPSSTNPSSTLESDQDTEDEDDDDDEMKLIKSESATGDQVMDTNSCRENPNKQQQQQQKTTSNSSGETIIADPKRIKRILANRQSAQRSRVRKLQYISELERSVTTLQNEVSALSPRVAYLDHQRLMLNVDNSALKQRIAALAQDNIFKDAHQEALRKEIERLRQIYEEQHRHSSNKMEDNNNSNTIQQHS